MAILAISLDFRSGGQEVATQIGEALGYKCSGKDQSIAYMKSRRRALGEPLSRTGPGEAVALGPL